MLHDDGSTIPSWKDPSIYPDSDKAVERVQRAIAEGETIAIFGDYDCDGVTSTAQLVRMLRRHGIEPIVRLPHRVHDGYGLQAQHVDVFAEKGVTLLLTADTGIGANDAIDRANSHGMDVIILDHHHFHTVPVNAFAILHPALAPNHSPFHPSAAGVVHAFVRAFEKGNMWEDEAIDLVLAALGTVADLVPLRGGNRLLVQAGLEAVGRLSECPLKHFIVQTCGTGPITSMDMGWKLAPRINAAGRIDDAMDALTALLEGGAALERLDAFNSQRQQETSDAVHHAILSLGPEELLPPFLCIASAGYGHGIVGLIAGKLTEKFNRPSLVACINGDSCVASLRSPPGYNVVEALERTSELLTRFGGHAQAAGASFPLDTFIALAERLEHDAAVHFGATQPAQTLTIDAVIDVESVHIPAYTAIQELAPFGQGNNEPLFLIRNLHLQNIRRVGAESMHLQARANTIPMIGFGLGHLANEIINTPCDIACTIGVNTWNGKTEAQLVVVDIRLSQEVRTKFQDPKQNHALLKR